MVIRDQVRQQLEGVARGQHLQQFLDELSDVEVRQPAVVLLRQLRQQGQVNDAEQLEDEIDSLDLVHAVTGTRDEATYAWEAIDPELNALEQQSR